MAETASNALISQFKFERLLNQDSAGRRVVLLGSISSQPALLLVERAAFSSDAEHLSALPSSLASISNLGTNDVYYWYMASVAASTSSSSTAQPPGLKLNLIYPCTPSHIKKYTPQRVRSVTETAEIYASYVQPYIAHQRSTGKLNWVFNILTGLTEQENVLYRTPASTPDSEKFLLLPDLNWDRTTLGSLHLLALPERRDIWTLRDLRVSHLPFLKDMVSALNSTIASLYGPGTAVGGETGVEPDELKMYVHYQPTYYHIHIHIVHVGLEAGATQAVGKAVALTSIISTLETMQLSGDAERGMHEVDIAYTLGEQSELWTKIYAPLKRGEKVVVGE